MENLTINKILSTPLPLLLGGLDTFQNLTVKFILSKYTTLEQLNRLEGRGGYSLTTIKDLFTQEDSLDLANKILEAIQQPINPKLKNYN